MEFIAITGAVVEPTSVDEAYIDVSATPAELDALREYVQDQGWKSLCARSENVLIIESRRGEVARYKRKPEFD